MGLHLSDLFADEPPRTRSPRRSSRSSLLEKLRVQILHDARRQPWASAGAQLLSSLGDWIETARRKVITLRRYATGLDHPDDVQAVTRSSQARLKQKRSSIHLRPNSTTSSRQGGSIDRVAKRDGPRGRARCEHLTNLGNARRLVALRGSDVLDQLHDYPYLTCDGMRSRMTLARRSSSAEARLCTGRSSSQGLLSARCQSSLRRAVIAGSEYAATCLTYS